MFNYSVRKWLEKTGCHVQSQAADKNGLYTSSFCSSRNQLVFKTSSWKQCFSWQGQTCACTTQCVFLFILSFKYIMEYWDYQFTLTQDDTLTQDRILNMLLHYKQTVIFSDFKMKTSGLLYHVLEGFNNFFKQSLF